jgi:hypothetical protein
MLTKNDLNQISELLDERLDVKLDVKLEPIKKDIKFLKRDVSRIKKTQDTMLDLLDREQMQQRKRIVRLEEHVGLPIAE